MADAPSDATRWGVAVSTGRDMRPRAEIDLTIMFSDSYRSMSAAAREMYPYCLFCADNVGAMDGVERFIQMMGVEDAAGVLEELRLHGFVERLCDRNGMPFWLVLDWWNVNVHNQQKYPVASSMHLDDVCDALGTDEGGLIRYRGRYRLKEE